MTNHDRQDVVLVCHNLADGGTQRVVALLAEAWSRRGRPVTVVTLYDRPDFYHLPADVGRVSLGGDRYTIVRRTLKLLRELGSTAGRLWPDAGPQWLRAIRSVVFSAGGALAHGLGWVLRRLLGEKGLEFLVRIVPISATRVRGLRTAIQKLEPSVVVSFGGPTNVLSVLACRDRSARLVICERNDPHKQVLNFPWNDLRPHTYAEADVVTTNSKGTLDALRAWVPAERLRIVPNPLVIPSGGLSTLSAPSRNGPKALIVGRLNEQKGHDVLLRAFSLLPDDLHHWKLAVVGRGERERALRRLASRLGLSDRVEWHGQVVDPGAHYRASDLFVLPSRHEGMPNALLEAMSFGLPPIVSDASPGPLEVVRHRETGLVVPAGDPDALASAIALLANSSELRAELGEAARTETARYDLTTALEAWEDALGWSSGSANRP